MKPWKRAVFKTVPAIIILALFSVFYIERLWELERHSFFSFSPLYLQQFISGGALLPGRDAVIPVGRLLGGFCLQFYYQNWAYANFIFLGLCFTLFSLACAKRLCFCNRKLSPGMQYWVYPTGGAALALVWCFMVLSPRFPSWFPYALLLNLTVFTFFALIKNDKWRYGLFLFWIFFSPCAFGWITTLYLVILVVLQIAVEKKWHRLWLLLPCFIAGIVFSAGVAYHKNFSLKTAVQADFQTGNRMDCWGTDTRLYLLAARVERLCMEERYEEALHEADRYWFSHPVPVSNVLGTSRELNDNFTLKQRYLRLRLAMFTKTAMIGSNRLCNLYFSYFRIPEILFASDAAYTMSYDFAGMTRQRVMDNPTAVYFLGMNFVENSGFPYGTLLMSVPAMAAAHQWVMAEKYIKLLSSTLFYRNTAKTFDRAVKAARSRNPEGLSDKESKLYNQIISWDEKGLKSYLDPLDFYRECKHRWEENPTSLAVLENLWLQQLLAHRLEDVFENIPAYAALTGQTSFPYRLPLPVQEAALITDNTDNMEILPTVVKTREAFLNAASQYRSGLVSLEEVTRIYGHTYIFWYYFFQAVPLPDLPQNPQNFH